MALSIASVGSLGHTKTAATASLGVPTGVTNGALVCAAVMVYSSAPSTPTLDGFTLSKATTGTLTAWGYTWKIFWFYKYATGSDTGSYTAHITAGNILAGYAFRPAGWTGSGDPFVDTLHEGALQDTAVSLSTFTPGGNNSMLVAVWMDDGPTKPAAFTQSATATDDDGDNVTLAYLTQTTAAATGSLSFGGSGGTVVSLATLRQSAAGSQFPVSGTAHATSSAFGTVHARHRVTGKAAISSAAFGTAHSRAHVSGQASATSTSFGTVHARRPVSGSATISSGSFGTVHGRRAVAGHATATSGSFGTAHALLSVGGMANAISSAFGLVDVLGATGVMGFAHAKSDSFGSVHAIHAVSGTAHATSSAFGTAHSRLHVAGNAASRSGAFGNVAARRSVSGFAAAFTTAFGTVSLNGETPPTPEIPDVRTLTATYRLNILQPVQIRHTLDASAPDRTLKASPS